MAKRKAKAAEAVGAGAEGRGTAMAAVLGFVAMGGIFPALVVALWLQPLPVLIPDAPVEATAVEEEKGQLVYVPLQNPVSVALGSGARLQAYLAIAVRGEPLELAALNQRVETLLQPIEAAMLVEAQGMMAEGADGGRLHAEMPERMRAVMNHAIGTADWPEPVEEVLVTSLVVQD